MPAFYYEHVITMEERNFVLNEQAFILIRIDIIKTISSDSFNCTEIVLANKVRPSLACPSTYNGSRMVDVFLKFTHFINDFKIKT